MVSFPVQNCIKRQTFQGTTDNGGNLLLRNINVTIPLFALVFNTTNNSISAFCNFFQIGPNLEVNITGASNERIPLANQEVKVDLYYMER